MFWSRVLVGYCQANTRFWLVLRVTLYLCAQASIHELWTEQQDNKRPLSGTVSCFYDELLTKWRKEVREGEKKTWNLHYQIYYQTY